MSKVLNLYDKDFYAWTQEQAGLIKDNLLGKLDLIHLQEELINMGASEKRELGSRLTILLMHLLKWKYQPTRRGVSWELTIREQRLEVKDVLADNPSLKSIIDTVCCNSYDKAILKAAKEAKLSPNAFPETCEWTIDQILDSNFYPN